MRESLLSPDFSVCPHIVEGATEFCGIHLIRALLPFMRVSPSRPNHIPKAPPTETLAFILDSIQLELSTLSLLLKNEKLWMSTKHSWFSIQHVRPANLVLNVLSTSVSNSLKALFSFVTPTGMPLEETGEEVRAGAHHIVIIRTEKETALHIA